MKTPNLKETMVVRKGEFIQHNPGVVQLTDFLTKVLEIMTCGQYTRVKVMEGGTILLKELGLMNAGMTKISCGSEIVGGDWRKYSMVHVGKGEVLRTLTLTCLNKELTISTTDDGRYMVKLPGEPWQTVTTQRNESLIAEIIRAAGDRVGGEINVHKRITGDLERDTEWGRNCTKTFMTPSGSVIAPKGCQEERKMKMLQLADAKLYLPEEYEKAGNHDYAESVRRSTSESLTVNGIGLPRSVREAYASAIMSGGTETEGQSGIVTKIGKEGGEKLLLQLKLNFDTLTALRLYKTLTDEATVKSFIIGTEQNQTDRIYSQLTTRMKYDRNKDEFTTGPQLREDSLRHTRRPLYIHGSDNRKTIINTKEKNGVITEATTEHTRISGCSTYDPYMNGVIEDGENLEMGLARTTVTTKVTSTDALEDRLKDTKVTRNGWATALSVKELAEVR
ncbi:hypothetical protein GQ105_005592 [Salmonella enterica]|nr:hypothetical protein [Salmonella enterica]